MEKKDMIFWQTVKNSNPDVKLDKQTREQIDFYKKIYGNKKETEEKPKK